MRQADRQLRSQSLSPSSSVYNRFGVLSRAHYNTLMSNTLAFLYRLFAPLVVVILIIAGVDMSSELLQSARERQAALSVASANTCPIGTVPATPCPPPQEPYPPTPCMAVVPGGPIVAGVCNPMGCCMGTTYASAGSIVSQAAPGLLSGLMQGLLQMLQGGQSSDSSGSTGSTGIQVYDKAPECKSLAVSPTLISPGGSATLAWTVEGGTPEAVVVAPDVGLVGGYSVRVSPSVSTTYTVTLRNRVGSSQCPTVRLHVGPGNGTEDPEFTGGVAGESGDGIWGGADTTGAGSPSSVYDDIWNTNTNTNTNSNTTIASGEEGSDGSAGLVGDAGAGSTATLADTTGGTYYYGSGDTTDWSLFTGTSSRWEVTDVQSDNIVNTYTNGRTGNLINNPNGLTDQEIYGVWSRPQSPATGGLGLSSGGYDTSAVDFTSDASPSIFTRLINWFKNVFCFWCDNSALKQSVRQLAATGASVFGGAVDITVRGSGGAPAATAAPTTPAPTAAPAIVIPEPQVIAQKTGSYYTYKVTQLPGTATRLLEYKHTFEFLGKNIYLQVVDKSVKGVEPRTGWLGYPGTLELTISKDDNSQVILYAESDAVTRRAPDSSAHLDYPQGWTEMHLKYFKGGSDMEYSSFWASVQNKKVEIDATILCDADVVTLYPRAMNPAGTQVQAQESGSVTLNLHQGSGTAGVLGDYIVYCGEPPVQAVTQPTATPPIASTTLPTGAASSTGENTESLSGCFTVNGERFCGEVSPPPTTEDPFGSDSGSPTPAQTRTTNMPKVGDPCPPEHGGTVVQINGSQVLCSGKNSTGGTTDAQRQAQQAAQQRAMQQAAQQAAQRAAQQQAQQAAQQRAQQQADAQRQAEQTWLQQLLARLRSATSTTAESKPVCSAFNVSDTSISAGDEITLSWDVTGASKIVITPKVTVTVENGRQVAKAKPQSNVQYTLIASNQYGETRCQTPEIVVADAACASEELTAHISITPDEVTRPACATGQSSEECDDAWEGEEVTVAWDAEPQQCIAQCTLKGPDGLVNDSVAASSTLTGLLRKTSTFSITCVHNNGDDVYAETSAAVTQE